MKCLRTILVAASCVLCLGAFAWADDARDKQFEHAKAAIKQGAYHDALVTLDAILAEHPDDTPAKLYRLLCERRLTSTSAFAVISAEQLEALKRALHHEEQAEHQALAKRKAVDAQLRQEQERWDHELDALERQAKRDESVNRKRAQVEAAQQVRLQRAQAHEAAPQPPETPPTALAPEAPRPQEAAPSETPALPAETPRSRRPTEPSSQAPTGREAEVELSPVIVPTTAGEQPKVPPTSPSLVVRPKPPPGAVQINARQMSVSPERKLAVAEGDVEVIFENAVLTADRLTLFTDTNDVYAEGRVRLEQGDQVFRGEMVHYNFNTKKGRFLQGTVSSPPWHQHGRSIEHIAEGVYEVTPGYLTSCEMEPPHFRFAGRRVTVFADDRVARAQNVAFFVEQVPFLYLPWISFSDRQSPFFIIPGKRKPWGEFALMGYRYELPLAKQRGTLKMDWRRNFHWGFGVDHQFESKELGKGLLKLYYNQSRDILEPLKSLPKGADRNRYRILWRHSWRPLPDTTMVTDIQKFSDINFRKEFLFHEEFSNDDLPNSFISTVTNTPDYTLSTLIRKRMNRFQTVDEVLPQVTFDVREHRIGNTQAFSKTTFDVASFNSKQANSGNDTDVVRVDWFQQLSYALGLFRPILVTPNVGIRQTFYSKDIQNGPDNAPVPRQGQRDLFSGQFSGGADASLKLFRVFPVTTNVLGLNLNLLRHVLTPSVSYQYDHPSTVPNALVNFPAAILPTNMITWNLESKLQTRRPDASGKLHSVDLVRLLASLPYTFRGNGNKSGGRLNDWAFNLELYPWSWLRLKSDWNVLSHVPDTLTSHYKTWNLDMVMVGGKEDAEAKNAPQIQAPQPQAFQTGNQTMARLLPQGQWYLGLGHRFSQNDKTETVLEYDWRLSRKWQINTFHRFTWKEVAGGAKRFNNLREYQYTLQRDLHDWVANFIYRVDREFGEEIYFTLTLKAFPQMPIAMADSYHQPKVGSQSSPFSPPQFRQQQ